MKERVIYNAYYEEFEDFRSAVFGFFAMLGTLYRNNLKNREFDKEAPQILHPRRADVFIDTVRGANAKFEVKPTSSKTDSSGYFGITADSTMREEFRKRVRDRFRPLASHNLSY